MITLKIKQPGHIVAIPGLPVFRSPVKVDISKLDIRVVSMYLKTADIGKYEIIAESGEQKEIYTENDFDDKPKLKKIKEKNNKALNKRFNKIELMLESLLKKETGNDLKNKEQIINKLNDLEKKISKAQSTTIIKEKVTYKDVVEDEIEKVEAFIPDIDISDMKLTGSENVKTVKQDEGLEESADILAELMKNKNKGMSEKND